MSLKTLLSGLLMLLVAAHVWAGAYEANQRLVARYQAERDTLAKKEALTASESRRLDQLEKNIESLLRDAKKLTPTPPSRKEREQIQQVETTTLHERALELVSSERMSQAAEIYEQIVMINPDDDEAYLLLGHCYILTERYQRAESAYQNAVHLDPQNFYEIAPFFENLIVQDPSNDAHYVELGYAYIILEEFIKSKKAFLDALQINPANQKAAQGLELIAQRGL